MQDFFPKPEDSRFLIIDAQGKLLKVMPENYGEKIERLVKIANEFSTPILVSEQYPKGLGKTCEVIAKEFLPTTKVFEKVEFSCFKNLEMSNFLLACPERTLIIAGMESHICVFQTVIDALKKGFKVFLLADCICSRSENEKRLALRNLEKAGAKIISTEMLAFAWLEKATNNSFKAISKLIV